MGRNRQLVTGGNFFKLVFTAMNAYRKSDDRNSNISSDPVVEQTATTPANISNRGDLLLEALWRSPNRTHQIGSLNRASHRFTNISVKNAVSAFEQAKKMSVQRTETYFACAAYKTEFSRTTENVSGALAFWVDLDCGDGKVDDEKGYLCIEDAMQALLRFCHDAGLPLPTHIVSSGGGVHAYWVVTCQVPRDLWLQYASKLKAVAKALHFLADPTRTADIASVLRIPGTLNYKYSPPRPVTLLSATDAFIERSTMLSALDQAYSQWCPAVVHPQSAWAEKPHAQSCGSDWSATTSPSLEKQLHLLSVILACLDPACGRSDWFSIAGALYYTTSGAGYGLFDAWSSAGGKKYKGRHDTKCLWAWFKPDSERKFSMGTLRRLVQANGYDWYEVCASVEEGFCLDECEVA